MSSKYTNCHFKGSKNTVSYGNKAKSNQINATNVITSSLVSNNIQASNVYSDIKPYYASLTIIHNNVLEIDPDRLMSYIGHFNKIDNSSSEINFSLDVDTTHSEINAKLTLIFYITTNNHAVNLTFSDRFHYSRSGKQVKTKDLSTNKRWVIPFVFDGEVFVNSNDSL